MTSIADNFELRDRVDKILMNWGRWCRDDWRRHLDYSVQPMFKDYRSPRQEPLKSRMPIDVNEAVMANDAVVTIGMRHGNGFMLYRVLVAWYAFGKSPAAVARQVHCARSTAYVRKDRAIAYFWDEYQIILLNNRLNTDKYVA